jgi:hypothetical protein
MFGRKRTITVKVKLFSGLKPRCEGYDPVHGLTLVVPSGTRLRKVVKSLGLTGNYRLAYFVNGQRVGLWKRLQEDCEIFCMLPSAGG